MKATTNETAIPPRPNSPVEEQREKVMRTNKHEDQHTWGRAADFRVHKLQHEQQEATPTENRFLKALHWMRCPECGHELASQRHGSIEIDICQSCGGVWLDSIALQAIVAVENEFLRSCLSHLGKPLTTNRKNAL